MIGRDSSCLKCFLMILVIAFLFRFYRINENLVFHGELGDNYLVIKNTIGKGVVPLLGPPTSHPWLSFGPLFYYIFAPFLILNHYNPVTGAYFFGTISILGLIANYYVVKKFFSVKVALISSYLIAISPIWIDIARQSRFFSMVTYLFYPFLLLTLFAIQNAKYMFWLGLVLGIMINFHLTPIFLIPSLVLLFFLKRKNIRRKDVSLGIIGFVIPNIPFLIYNIKNHFEMITKFAVWIPYRSAIYHNFNLGFTLDEILRFFGGLFFLIPILVAIYLERKNKYVRILCLFLVFGIIALILHKDPPTHYFYVLYPIPVIFLSLFFSKLKSFLIFTLLVLITVINFSYLFSDRWFYINENAVKQNYNIPYKLQREAAERIVNDANGEPYNLHRVGFSDQFEGEFAQNYRYLLWLYGNEPKDYKTNLSYKIVEYPNMEIIKEQK